MAFVQLQSAAILDVTATHIHTERTELNLSEIREPEPLRRAPVTRVQLQRNTLDRASIGNV
jgi:hypothetical protein